MEGKRRGDGNVMNTKVAGWNLWGRALNSSASLGGECPAALGPGGRIRNGRGRHDLRG